MKNMHNSMKNSPRIQFDNEMKNQPDSNDWRTRQIDDKKLRNSNEHKVEEPDYLLFTIRTATDNHIKSTQALFHDPDVSVLFFITRVLLNDNILRSRIILIPGSLQQIRILHHISLIEDDY
jgi:hypothetical protein